MEVLGKNKKSPGQRGSKTGGSGRSLLTTCGKRSPEEDSGDDQQSEGRSGTAVWGGEAGWKKRRLGAA